jgi:tetratricopeptide (TPR) repeat protein
MSRVRCVAGFVAAAVVLFASVGWGVSPDRAVSEGNHLLAKGDLHGALKAYAAALQEDRSNAEYAQQFMLVRRVLLLEDRLSKETDPSRRVEVCQALRAFYVSHGLRERSLPLDEEIFERLGTANAAIQLAETHLALDREAAATQLLSSLKADRANDATQALLSVALARQGKLNEARKVAGGITATEDAGPGTLYIFARMRAALGEEQFALTTLKRCLESVPPSQIDSLRSHARACADFASLARSESFAEVLKTESKVPESPCSGGSHCGNCPMRGNCQASRGH